MAVGLRGVFLACKRAVQQMLTQEPVGEARGRIIAISSQHGMVGPPGHVAYCGRQGRRRQPDAPDRGRLRPARDHLQRDRAGQDPDRARPTSPTRPETLAYSHARTPFPRLGRPEDVASLAVFLASDECTYMSGANVMVDGGWMAY